MCYCCACSCSQQGSYERVGHDSYLEVVSSSRVVIVSKPGGPSQHAMHRRQFRIQIQAALIVRVKHSAILQVQGRQLADSSCLVTHPLCPHR